MFHGVIHKITLAQFFLRHGVESLTYILPPIVRVYLHSNFSDGLRKTFFYFCKVTFRSFKIIQGHWFWYQSKVRMRVRLPISPS